MPLTSEIIQTAEGRNLDRLVAEHVFGWDQVGWDGDGRLYGCPPCGSRRERPVPRFSEDLNMGMEAVEETARLDSRFTLSYDGAARRWTCRFGQAGPEGEGATAAIAFFRAALLGSCRLIYSQFVN